MRRRSPAVLLLSALLAVPAACGSGGGRATTAGGSVGGRVSVVATTTQLADFARAVGGNHVDVYGLLKPNLDPHDYEPSPADVARLATAAVIVKNGVGLERWFDATIRNAEPKGAIVDASTGIALRRGPGTDRDPHIWHDPRNARVMVHTIATALAGADPAHRVDYEAAEAAYAAELDRLDAEIAAEIGGLADKKLVTNHDAFGYYVARYGLDFVGAVIPSFDSQAELSAADVAGVVKLIRKAGVKAVFSEASVPPKTAEAIGREAGVAVVAGPDALYGDSLGPAGSDGDTYLRMERHNTREIVDHLR
ncbi:MAG TPA: metal ABC transporter substrate-binding protein [Acidimicrobiia bacterium]|nr:metal ABC transporter substrate-binding protein [Acidimicrobiia bacterium]